MSASACTTNAAHESEIIFTIEAKLIAKQAELLILAQEVSNEENTVQNLCEEAERKRLEAKEVSNQWADKSGALLSKKNQHELLVEDLRMHTAYLERICDVEAGNKEENTFEEHLKRENKELENKVGSLQQALNDTKTSMDEEISRLKVGFDALAITNRYTSASLNQEIDRLKAEKELLAITNSDTIISMGEVIDELKAEVASLTAINHDVTSTTEKNSQLGETAKKNFGHMSAQPEINGQGARASFLESHRLRGSEASPYIKGLLRDGSKPDHHFHAVADATLYRQPVGPGFRTDCDTFSRIYGVKWQTAWRLKSCRLFNYLVNQYAAAESYNPQTFGTTEFFKLWCGMGISFDERILVRTNAWFQRATSNNRKPVPWHGLGPALDKIYSNGSIPQYPGGVASKDKSKDMLIHEIQKNAKFYAKMQSLLQQVGFAVRNRYLERMRSLPVYLSGWCHRPDMAKIEEGNEAAHHADALLDALLFFPEIFNIRSRPTPAFKYKDIYEVAPVDQWHPHDFVSTDFYGKWEHYGLLDLCGRQAEDCSTDWTPSRDWESWPPPSESPDWSLTVEILARLYLFEERESKKKQRNLDSLLLTKPDQLHPVIGGLSNQEIPRPESPINYQCYYEGESRAYPNSRDEPSSQLAAKDSNAIEWRPKPDLGPSDNDSTTRGEAPGPSLGATTNSRGGDNLHVGDDCLVPALYKSEKSDLYDHGGWVPQAAAADSYQGSDWVTKFKASDDYWGATPDFSYWW
ncbi:hypothetical protein OCU04_006441 [Sclerotinia nivalis]|uniref:Uncharacterized protein n=1 Tax=Sclerotinia nivalis TaxID=352851 RepID=A0A9X0DLA4_9HELO|nr:hypothetical protein OCU04_006441 [Sclerotinia nivalis]